MQPGSLRRDSGMKAGILRRIKREMFREPLQGRWPRFMIAFRAGFLVYQLFLVALGDRLHWLSGLAIYLWVLLLGIAKSLPHGSRKLVFTMRLASTVALTFP